MAALAPELSGIVRDRVLAVVHRANSDVPRGTRLPPHVSPEYIGDYVEYAADVAQAMPSLLLPLFGSILVANETGLAALAVALLVVVVPGSIFAFIRALMADPISYASRKRWGRYALLPFLSLCINIVATMLVVIFELAM